MNNKKIIGWLAFFGVAVTLAWLPQLFSDQDDSSDAVGSVALTSGKARSGATPTASEGAKVVAIKDLAPAGDLFSSRSWKPAVKLATVTETPIVQAPVVQAPTAPPLPFQFVGRLSDQRDLQVFLQSGEKIYVVRKGDVIDDNWRIVGISDKELNLVYLPMHLSQTLSVGSAP